MRMYQAPPSHPYADAVDNALQHRRPVNDALPTIYLIAFKITAWCRRWGIGWKMARCITSTWSTL